MTEEELKALKVEAADLFFLREANQAQIIQINNRLAQISQEIRNNKEE